MRLFAERLLVTRSSEPAPEPNGYDEKMQLSVDRDGQPFVEAFGQRNLVTLTEASGEAIDDDDDEDRRRTAALVATQVTQTFTDPEGVDEAADIAAAPRQYHTAPRWASTITKAQGEAPDVPTLTTQTRQAPGEAPGEEWGLWAFTKTEAPGEAPDT
jgi:putative ATP-grasp target RiPP